MNRPLRDRQKTALLRDEESPFGFEELFFSRTDERGIILSGNSVFQRVSAYDWDEILRKPHNIIRHPDMPKAVFWLLWDTIKKGAPIGAYVKNKAKDGRYYWVFAIVTPIEGQYLSVRLKPHGTLFDVVIKEYASLRRLEIDKQLKPEESAQLLLSRLQELGFTDYGAFMAAALSQVIGERDAEINLEIDDCIARFNELVATAQTLLSHATAIFSVYKDNEYVPLNLRVQAAQLGESGAPIGVISNNYTTISSEIQKGIEQVVESGKDVVKTINEGLFLAGTARIQREMYAFFLEEAPNDGASREEEMAYLEQQKGEYIEKAIKGLEKISVQITQFRRACTDMRKLTSGLEVTRIMGKIEHARIDGSAASLSSLISDLDTFQKEIQNGLKEIDQTNQTIQSHVNHLLKTLGV